MMPGSPPPPNLEPTFVTRPALRYAGIRQRLRRDALPEVVPGLVSEVFRFLRRHDRSAVGAPLIRYLVVDYNNAEVDVAIGVPVDEAALPDDARVHGADVPAGTFGTVTHRGAYATLMGTTAALLEWADRNAVRFQVTEARKVTTWAARVEHYLVGPPAETDPAMWRTEIAILVASGAPLSGPGFGPAPSGLSNPS